MSAMRLCSFTFITISGYISEWIPFKLARPSASDFVKNVPHLSIVFDAIECILVWAMVAEPIPRAVHSIRHE